MGFGWFLLFNGIVGIVIFYGTIFPFIIWLSRKYGETNADDGLHDTLEQSDMIGDRLTNGRIDLWKLLAYFMTFFLWEIEIPAKYYVIWQHVKSMNDLRENKED